jgi:Tfp pilus assembly protein PilN
MANINLSTNEMDHVGQERSSTKKGLISVIMILAFSIATYGGLIIWKRSLESKIARASEVYNTNYKQLMSGINIEVTDLQNRIFISKKIIKQRSLTRTVLENIEKNIVSGVYLTLYSSDIDARGLSLEGLANSYNDLSRQVLSLKSSEIFSSVRVEKSSILESGKISFLIKLEFK